MGETAYFITAIVSLSAAIVTLWLHNVKREKKYSEQLNENLIKMTKALTDSTNVIQNSTNVIQSNTKSHDRIYEYIVNGNGKKRN